MPPPLSVCTDCDHWQLLSLHWLAFVFIAPHLKIHNKTQFPSEVLEMCNTRRFIDSSGLNQLYHIIIGYSRWYFLQDFVGNYKVKLKVYFFNFLPLVRQFPWYYRSRYKTRLTRYITILSLLASGHLQWPPITLPLHLTIVPLNALQHAKSSELIYFFYCYRCS